MFFLKNVFELSKNNLCFYFKNFLTMQFTNQIEAKIIFEFDRNFPLNL